MAFKSVLRLLLLCFSVLGVAWGQQPLNPADSQFTQDFGTDSIHLQSLSVGIKAPVIAKPGAIPFFFALDGVSSCQGAVLNGTANTVCGFLNQDSASYLCEISFCLSLWKVPNAGHWMVDSTQAAGISCADGGTYTKYTNLALRSPDGSSYALPAADYTASETGGTTCNHTLTDTTLTGGISASLTKLATVVTLTFPNGTVYTGSSDVLTDPFGNSITPGAGTYTDTLGVNPALSFTAQSGSTGPIYTYKDTGGTSQQVKQILTPETVKTTFGCATWPDQTLTGKYAVTEIDYPDNNNIGLSYEVVAGGITGRIASVTLRTGGTVNYSYGSMNCPSMIPSSLTRTDATGARTYTFALSGTHGTTTTVLDPGKNKTVYTFQGTDSTGLPVQGTPLTLTQVQTWQNTGTVATPAYTLLSTTIYCYNNNTTACPTTQAAYPILHKDIYVAPVSKTTYSRTHYDYDAGCGGSCGLVTSIARYDFVAIGTGTADNTTAITYGSWSGSCVPVGSSIINLPCEVKTTAGANTLSDARYTYSAKGFQTQVQQWTNANGWMIMGSASPNTNGTAASTANALGQSTTYTYAATGSGGCNAILPTETSTTVNSVPLTTSATWDCNMGKLTSSTDTNSNTSNFTYDLLGRPHTQTDPSGNYTLTEEHPTNVTETISDTFISTTVRVDGLGRPIRTQTTDGASYDTVSSAYAFSGTQFQVSASQPCIAALNADCTKNHFGVVDPLGRSISSSTTSNETLATAFNQNDLATTLSPAPAGENTKKVQEEFDGMGRLKSTCAIQATGGTACGQVDGNSGILTTAAYSYSAGGVTTTATRGAQAHSTFRDNLGRAKSVTLPESGTATYIYDTEPSADNCHSSGFSSPGTLLRMTNPDGSYNCYDYDGLARVTDVGISAPPGTCRRYRYDSTANGIVSAPTGYPTSTANVKGKLVEAVSDGCGLPLTPITDEWFAYDADGRVTDVWESTPNSGGYYHTTVTYASNGKLASLSGVPGKSTYTLGLDANGRLDTSTYGATAIATNVTYNGAGQVTQIDYGTDNDKYTYDANTGLTKTWIFKQGTPTQSATLTWDTNRTLGTLAIVDGINAVGTKTCNYGYDDVVRLTTENCGAAFNDTYAYDQYDNFSKSGTSNWNPGYNSTITCPTGTICNHITGANYDGNGRLTYDLNNSYAWDVYGKMITTNSGASLGSCGSAGVTCVTYDAFGRAVEKNVSGTNTEYLYSPIGLTGVMNGMTTTSMRVPVPGGATFINNSSGNIVAHADWVGSLRVAETLSHSLQRDAAFSSYGETIANSGTGGLLQFAQMPADLSSGLLFDTPNREFDVSAGSRWLSPDPAMASWNAYSYPTNPNSFIDPSGLENCSNTSKTCKPQRGTPGGTSGSGGPMDLDGSIITSPDGAFGYLYPSFFGSTTTNTSTVIQVGGQSYQLVPGPDGCGNTSCGAGYVAVGNGLNPFMTVNPYHGTGTGKSLHKKKQKLNRILPFLVMLAHQPTPEEWAMYYQVAGDTAASLETEWIASMQELLALGNMTPPAVLANDQSVIPLLDSMMGTYAGGTMAVGGGMSMAGPAGAGFAAAGMAVIYLGYESISPENTNQFMPPMN